MLPIFEFLKDIFFYAGYIAGGKAFPQALGSAQEREYIDRHMSGDEEARGKLIEHNLRLVAHIAKKYSSSSVDMEDLISIGTVGLIKGVNTFNPEKANSLAAYISRCIENEILMYLRSLKKSSGDVSLADPIGEDREGNRISLADILGTNPAEVEDKIEFKVQVSRLGQLLGSVLSKRERIVIELRYGLSGKDVMPQREVADVLDISRSYVSRIEKKALEKLHTTLGKEGWE